MKSQKQQRQEFIEALEALRRPYLDWNRETKQMEEKQVPPTLILDRDHEGQIIVSAEDGLGWCDYYAEYLRESLDDDGKIQNAFGIATALHDVADEHGYFWEWENAGCIVACEL